MSRLIIFSKLLKLDDPLRGFIPRLVFLLVKALPDLEYLPDNVAEQIASTLLSSYGNPNGLLFSFPAMRQQVHKAFKSMLLGRHKNLQKVTIDLLTIIL